MTVIYLQISHVKSQQVVLSDSISYFVCCIQCYERCYEAFFICIADYRIWKSYGADEWLQLHVQTPKLRQQIPATRWRNNMRVFQPRSRENLILNISTVLDIVSISEIKFTDWSVGIRRRRRIDMPFAEFRRSSKSGPWLRIDRWTEEWCFQRDLLGSRVRPNYQTRLSKQIVRFYNETGDETWGARS